MSLLTFLSLILVFLPVVLGQKDLFAPATQSSSLYEKCSDGSGGVTAVAAAVSMTVGLLKSIHTMGKKAKSMDQQWNSFGAMDDLTAYSSVTGIITAAISIRAIINLPDECHWAWIGVNAVDVVMTLLPLLTVIIFRRRMRTFRNNYTNEHFLLQQHLNGPLNGGIGRLISVLWGLSILASLVFSLFALTDRNLPAPTFELLIYVGGIAVAYPFMITLALYMKRHMNKNMPLSFVERQKILYSPYYAGNMLYVATVMGKIIVNANSISIGVMAGLAAGNMFKEVWDVIAQMKSQGAFAFFYAILSWMW